MYIVVLLLLTVLLLCDFIVIIILSCIMLKRAPLHRRVKEIHVNCDAGLCWQNNDSTHVVFRYRRFCCYGAVTLQLAELGQSQQKPCNILHKTCTSRKFESADTLFLLLLQCQACANSRDMSNLATLQISFESFSTLLLYLFAYFCVVVILSI